MAHPQMFENDDPVLARLSELCLVLPGADMKVSHGRPAFFTKKIFAGYGAVVKGEHDSDRYNSALLFMPDPSELAALEGDDRVFFPAYWGPSGWRGIDLAAPEVDWQEVAELVEDSYRATAPRKLVAQLDASPLD